MKKIIAIVMTALMLLAVLAPAASATTTSPVKSYDDAQKGELLYTVNFNGDSAFEPYRTTADEGNMEYDIVNEGAGVRIHAKTDALDKKGNYWGGLIKDLEANEDTIYSMVYKAKSNGKVGKNNSLSVGGWAISENAFDATGSGVYNNYANYTTVDSADSTADQRHALSEGVYKMGDPKIDNDTDGSNGYKYTKDFAAYDVDDDGFQTVLVVYNGRTLKFANYILKSGATDLKDESSWIKLDERWMRNAIVDPNVPNYMCFWTYAHYNVVDTTIKNVEFYKDYLWADPNAPDTTAATTAAKTTAATTAKVTKAATTAAATKPATTTAAAEEKGCGGTITVAGIALVASLGTCAVYVEKKRRK